MLPVEIAHQGQGDLRVGMAATKNDSGPARDGVRAAETVGSADSRFDLAMLGQGDGASGRTGRLLDRRWSAVAA